MAKDKTPPTATPIEKLFPRIHKKIDESKLRLRSTSIGNVHYVSCQATGIGTSIRNPDASVKAFLEQQNKTTRQWLKDRKKPLNKPYKTKEVF